MLNGLHARVNNKPRKNTVQSNVDWLNGTLKDHEALFTLHNVIPTLSSFIHGACNRTTKVKDVICAYCMYSLIIKKAALLIKDRRYYGFAKQECE